jgi:hypothetical protein
MGDRAVDFFVVIFLNRRYDGNNDDLLVILDMRGQGSEKLENKFQNDDILISPELLLAKDMTTTVNLPIGETQNTVFVMFLVIKVHNVVVAADTKHGDGIQMIVLGRNWEIFKTEIGMTVTVHKEHS